MTGSIKTYTPNFKMIIPEFNIATWHDYIEENFRSIDALFHNLFGINGFSGIWKTNSQYTAGQVLFIGEDNGSLYEGRLVKVTQDTNTGGFATFSEAIKLYPNHYEMYADASSAEIFATLAQDWATKTGSTIKTPTGEDTGEYSAKHYAQLAGSHEERCEMYKNLSDTNLQLTQEAATSAEINENNSKVWADGNDNEVQSLGGTHSSVISAGLAFSYANADEDVPVEEWATQHDLIVQGEKGDKGDIGPRGPEGPEGPKGDKTYANKGTYTLSADGWTTFENINTYSLTVKGVKTDSIVWVSPTYDSFEAYSKAMIFGNHQDTNKIVFVCKTQPTEDINVEVVVA